MKSMNCPPNSGKNNGILFSKYEKAMLLAFRSECLLCSKRHRSPLLPIEYHKMG